MRIGRRGKHAGFIGMSLFVATVLFYLGHVLWLTDLGRSVFTNLIHQELGYLLFPGSVVYAAIVFRVKGGMVITLIASLAVLPDAFWFLTGTAPLYKFATFVILNTLVAGFIGTMFNRREQLQKEGSRLQRYLSQTIGAQERQNRYLARWLHETTLQALVDVSHDIDNLLETEADSEATGKTRLQQLRHDVDNVQEETRQLIQGLRPPLLEELGLAASLKWLVRKITEELHIKANLDIQNERKRLTGVQELSLFRIAQEALNNIKKHAQATRVELSLVFTKSKVRLRITDNGIGFSICPQYQLAREGKFGLIGMTERGRLIKGTIKCESAVGKGTTITAQTRLLNTE